MQGCMDMDAVADCIEHAETAGIALAVSVRVGIRDVNSIPIHKYLASEQRKLGTKEIE